MVGLSSKVPLRVVVITDTFAESMGYAGSRLPAALSKFENVDVHLVTAGLPAYYQIESYGKTYKDFQKPKIAIGEVHIVDGFSVHYIDHKPAYGGIRLIGLREKLAELKPNIVQIFVHTGWSAIDAARFQPSLGYKLFTGNHSGKIVYTPAQMALKPWSPVRVKEFLKRGLPGRFISARTELCYGATQDCSDVATEFFGVPKSKVKTTSLGVETEIFHPVANDAEMKAAQAIRQKFGVGHDEIMCLYTGKMTEEKNALLLATAVADLRQQGHPFKSVFYGAGPEVEGVAKVDGAKVHPFVHYKQLGDVYRACDIAVWPTQITTSTLDAAACGIPIVVNDQILANERYEGNGLTYKLNDLEDLKRALLQLKDKALRASLGHEGARKMREEFSWNALAKVRLNDYKLALGRNT